MLCLWVNTPAKQNQFKSNYNNYQIKINVPLMWKPIKWLFSIRGAGWSWMGQEDTRKLFQFFKLQTTLFQNFFWWWILNLKPFLQYISTQKICHVFWMIFLLQKMSIAKRLLRLLILVTLWKIFYRHSLKRQGKNLRMNPVNELLFHYLFFYCNNLVISHYLIFPLIQSPRNPW